MKDKAARCLRSISLGKYQTTLYNKTGSPFMSSILGGIISLIFVIIIAAYSASLLSSIFMRDKYNLDLRSREIRAYQVDEKFNYQ
jgi:hypothetical protein